MEGSRKERAAVNKHARTHTHAQEEGEGVSWLRAFPPPLCGSKCEGALMEGRKRREGGSMKKRRNEVGSGAVVQQG